MAKTSGAAAPFKISGAFLRAGRAVVSHGAIPFLLSLISAVLVLGLFVGGIFLYLQQAGAGRGQSVAMPIWFPFVTLGGWIVLAAVGQTLAAQAVNQALIGERARFSAALRSLWLDAPLAIVLLLGQWLLIGLGLVMVVVPGLIFAVLFSMVIPARVAGGGGLLNAFRQSYGAARGNGWRLAAYLLIADLAGAAFVFLGNALGDAVSRLSQTAITNSADSPLTMAVVIGAAACAVVFLTCIPFLFGLFPAAAYAELKAARDDGVVASAFD